MLEYLLVITYRKSGLKTEIREHVKEYLSRAKKKGSVIVDLGGTGNKWCDEFVDFYVDIKARGTKNCIMGDLLEVRTWEKIAKLRPSFVICTHTLEDIRDPKFVIGEINKLNVSVFISVPNKQTELYRGIESLNYSGYAHHRYMFTIRKEQDKDVLFGLAKYPLYATLPTGIRFARPVQVSKEYELGFMFKNKIPFKYTNNDFCGENIQEMLEILKDFVENGL